MKPEYYLTFFFETNFPSYIASGCNPSNIQTNSTITFPYNLYLLVKFCIKKSLVSFTFLNSIPRSFKNALSFPYSTRYFSQNI